MSTFYFQTKIPGRNGWGFQGISLKERGGSAAAVANSHSVRWSAVDFEILADDGSQLTQQQLHGKGITIEMVFEWVKNNLPSVLPQAAPRLARGNYHTVATAAWHQQDTGAITMLIGVAHNPLAHTLCQPTTESVAV